MDRERLQRIRNFQSTDWYPAIVIRPITILVMLLIADWKLLTPNRLTTIANLIKLGAAWLILDPDRWIWAVVLMQLGVLFDHLDGTIARYRRTFTKLGSFYDKVSDIVLWWLIMLAAGWQTYRMTGEAYYIMLAVASVAAMDVRAYMKWLMQVETERIRWLEAREDPAAAVARRTAPIVVKPPPVRTRRDWAIWFVKRFAAIWMFEEMDLWFWLGLALVLDRLPWGIWLLFVTQVFAGAALIVVRLIEIAGVDRRLRELEQRAS
jgi:phosphatidylglycerophosphate synthase